MVGLKGVAEYFGVTLPNISIYVKKHLDEINSDGQHAFIHKGKWHFDDIAIARLEKLRSNLPIENKLVSKTSSEINNLREEVQKVSSRIDNLESSLAKLFEKMNESGKYKVAGSVNAAAFGGNALLGIVKKFLK